MPGYLKSLRDFLDNLLVILLPAAITSGKIFFWIILFLFILILIPVSLYKLIKNKWKLNIDQIRNSNKISSATAWAAGAIVFILGDCISGAIIWIIMTVLLIAADILDGKDV